MPRDLTRATVTTASQVMLPTYALVNIGYGIALASEPTRDLLDVPAYRTLHHEHLTIHAWGWLFVLAGLLQLAALAWGRRALYRYTLSLGIILGGALTLAVLWGAHNGSNPWTAPWFPLCYTAACWASLRSLTASER